MEIFTLDQLKQSQEAKIRHREMLEQIKQQRLRAIQQLDRKIDKLRLEESLLRRQIREHQQDTVSRALVDRMPLR